MKILYIVHYGGSVRSLYVDEKTGKLIKRICDGGSNIHVNLIKYLVKKENKVAISTYKTNYHLKAFFGKSKKIKMEFLWLPEFLTIRYHPIIGNLFKLTLFPIKMFFEKREFELCISVTDFLPDVISSFIYKTKHPSTKWVASFFLEAPKPWSKINPYRTNFNRFLEGLVYWSVQRISLFLINTKADVVLITSEPDAKKFDIKGKKRAVVCLGGVELKPSNKYFKSKYKIPLDKKKYDACFIGRFHCQKGVLELIKIWNLVCKKKKDAKLAMIGVGSLENQIKNEIKKFNLGKNVKLLGYKKGKAKYFIFKNSKIVVHPAIYDSGGMASAEAMAWGLPGVSFDLESLKTYYPKGFLKTPCFDFDVFANNILRLINSPKLYKKYSLEARRLIEEKWSWDKRNSEIYNEILNL